MNNIIQLPVTSTTTQTTETGKVSRKYADRRDREYLTESEVEQLQTAASKVGRHQHRDRTMILMAYRHALRCSELVSMRWAMVDLAAGTVHVKRLKGSRDSVQPLSGAELRALRRLKRDYAASPFVFTTERKGPLTTSTVRKMVARAGTLAGLGFPVHVHMLRHACGYKLANDGIDTRTIQQYLGHASITNTVRYTELAAGRFDGLWRD
jgi:type 1 fimbriae regulatory protein FimB/type 1 fimbriae regulatory protein FimE